MCAAGKYRMGLSMPWYRKVQTVAELLRAFLLERQGLVEGEELLLRAAK